ncbi:hypothetical protein EVAR_62654_1 [Eumeta japonica]|uniref:Uncharacterized protein n=1 Tax=Eumeta variegata TaxID=151549 RepID=A0A4C1Z088_EUMVA|nr:hypothetical protein EVAR_62654_1 [Eumeta japonica]
MDSITEVRRSRRPTAASGRRREPPHWTGTAPRADGVVRANAARGAARLVRGQHPLSRMNKVRFGASPIAGRLIANRSDAHAARGRPALERAKIF